MACICRVWPTTKLGEVGLKEIDVRVECTVILTGSDIGPVPNALVAVTPQLYVVPLLRPVTVMGEVALVTLAFPG